MTPLVCALLMHGIFQCSAAETPLSSRLHKVLSITILGGTFWRQHNNIIQEFPKNLSRQHVNRKVNNPLALPGLQKCVVKFFGEI